MASDKIVRLNPDARTDLDRQRKMLLLDRQHRIKNILLHVRSIAQTTYEENDNLERFYELFEARLLCVNRVHVLMGLSDAPLGLKELLGEELLAHAMDMDRHIDVGGPDIVIEQRAAPTFALAFHELLVNAIECGTMASAPGHIVVRWRIDRQPSDDHLLLEWCESEYAFNNAIETSGFGLKLVQELLPREIGGSSRVEYANDGLRCILEIPFRDVIRQGGMVPVLIPPTWTS